LANQFAVNIVEDGNGKSYATGFQLLLNPIWLSGEDYPLDVKVVYGNVVYLCILAHTSAIGNAPPSATYWTAQPDDTKSEFIVHADTFKVLTSTSADPVFSVAGDVISLNSTYVNIPTSLIVGSIGADPASVKSALSLAAMAYLSSVGVSNLDATVITDGKIVTGLINAAAIAIGDLSGASTVIANAIAGATFTSSSLLDYTKVNGTKPPSDADKTSLNTALDTTKVNGLASGTLIVGGYIGTGLVKANAISTTNLAALNAWVGELQVSDTGYIRGGKPSFAHATAGFWMGYHSGAYKLHIGTDVEYFGWDGTSLLVGGDIIATGNIKALNITTGLIASNAVTTVVGATGGMINTLIGYITLTATADVFVQFSIVGTTTCVVKMYEGSNLELTAGGEGGLYSAGLAFSGLSAGTYNFTVTGTVHNTRYPAIMMVATYK